MKTFVGRMVTVSDGEGQSVSVSNWGVAQSSRHQSTEHVYLFLKKIHFSKKS
jgi:hypothetical protein